VFNRRLGDNLLAQIRVWRNIRIHKSPRRHGGVGAVPTTLLQGIGHIATHGRHNMQICVCAPSLQNDGDYIHSRAEVDAAQHSRNMRVQRNLHIWNYRRISDLRGREYL